MDTHELMYGTTTHSSTKRMLMEEKRDPNLRSTFAEYYRGLGDLRPSMSAISPHDKTPNAENFYGQRCTITGGPLFFNSPPPSPRAERRVFSPIPPKHTQRRVLKKSFFLQPDAKIVPQHTSGAPSSRAHAVEHFVEKRPFSRVFGAFFWGITDRRHDNTRGVLGAP